MQAEITSIQERPYVLGHSKHELDRLIRQARFWGDLTEHVMRLAGLKPGMRVLDVGCGAGDVSFLAASLVGPKGTVIGVDKSPEVIAMASQRAQAAGLANVHFMIQDLAKLTIDEPVDALIGRLVLMYFADPAVILRRLSRLLKPGGLVIFHEIDTSASKSEPICELLKMAVNRIEKAFSRVGADNTMGLKLAQVFQEAGLPKPQMIQGARVENGPDSEAYNVVAQLTRTLLPLMERTGIATAAEVEIDTLANRLREEMVALNATWVSPSLIGAWTRKGA
ncbi:MAG: class I SAM-dependent methyltransferase [Anaerolineae bacterium]|nr:class I SAM-dependent methyltransferase [Anaerolineae bacterium]